MMELPSLFSSSQPDSARKLFIALLVTENSIQASLWQVLDDSIVILERSDSRPYVNISDVAVKADACLQDLGPESENVDEVIFGLEPSWVGKVGILDERKPLIKKITDELSLKAIGFVVTIEALLHHLLQVQAMQSLIVINAGTKEVGLTLIKQGKLAGSQIAGRSGDLPSDITEALAHFTGGKSGETHLPPKILLFSTSLSDEELSDQEQTIINYDWVKTGIFGEPPVVELLPPNLLLDVITREGGQAVAQSLGLLPGKSGLGVTTSSSAPSTPPVAATPVVTAKPETALADDMVPVATSFGIPIKQTLPGSPVSTPISSKIATAPVGPTVASEIATDVPPKPHLSLPKFKLNNMSHKGFIGGGFLAGVLVLLLVGYFYLRLTEKAKIVLTLKSNTISQETQLTLDPKLQTADTANLILPAKLVTTDVTGNDSTVTTGTKLVGDPAKGTVTIFNKTTSPKTFSAGTVLASGAFKFTLDKDVSVASAAAQVDSLQFGKADGAITAAQIGPDSNLGKATNFSIAGSDSNTYSASNTDPLAGGTSREVRVVSADDQKNLMNTLRSTLIANAATQFKQQNGNGVFVVPTGKLTITTQTYNAKVGDEVNQLTLNLAGTAEGLSYNNSDFQPLAQQILSSQVPAGYQLVPDQLDVLSTPTPAASGSAQVKLTANISSQVKPTIDLEQLKQQLAGQSASAALKELKARTDISDVTITFQPPLAEKIVRFLPAAARLTIETK